MNSRPSAWGLSYLCGFSLKVPAQLSWSSLPPKILGSASLVRGNLGSPGMAWCVELMGTYIKLVTLLYSNYKVRSTL